MLRRAQNSSQSLLGQIKQTHLHKNMGREGDIRKGLRTKQEYIYTCKNSAGVCNVHMNAKNSVFNHLVKSFGEIKSNHRAEIL